MLSELRDHILPQQQIASVTANGAVDTRKYRDAITARGAAAIMPPRHLATPDQGLCGMAAAWRRNLHAPFRQRPDVLRRKRGPQRTIRPPAGPDPSPAELALARAAPRRSRLNSQG